MLEFYVGLKNACISVCWKYMLELHFYVGNVNILSDFYVGNTDTPAFLAKKSLKIAPFLIPEKFSRCPSLDTHFVYPFQNASS